MAILEIRRNPSGTQDLRAYYQIKWYPIKLNSARPFLIDDIELSKQPELQNDITEEEKLGHVYAICKEAVQNLLDGEKQKRRELGLGEMDMVCFLYCF